MTYSARTREEKTTLSLACSLVQMYRVKGKCNFAEDVPHVPINRRTMSYIRHTFLAKEN